MALDDAEPEAEEAVLVPEVVETPAWVVGKEVVVVVGMFVLGRNSIKNNV